MVGLLNWVSFLLCCALSCYFCSQVCKSALYSAWLYLYGLDVADCFC